MKHLTLIALTLALALAACNSKPKERHAEEEFAILEEDHCRVIVHLSGYSTFDSVQVALYDIANQRTIRTLDYEGTNLVYDQQCYQPFLLGVAVTTSRERLIDRVTTCVWEPGTVHVYPHLDSAGGTPLNDAYYHSFLFQPAYLEAQEELRRLTEEAYANDANDTTGELWYQVTLAEYDLRDLYLAGLEQVMDEHPDDLLGAYAYSRYLISAMSWDLVNQRSDMLPVAQLYFPAMLDFAKRGIANNPLRGFVGLDSRDRRMVSLDSLTRGHWTLVHRWGDGSGQELASDAMLPLYQQYAEKGLRFAAVVVSRTPSWQLAQADSLALPYPVLVDPEGPQSRYWGCNVLYLISPTGRVEHFAYDYKPDQSPLPTIIRASLLK